MARRRRRPDLSRVATSRVVTWRDTAAGRVKVEGPRLWWPCPRCGLETSQRFYADPVLPAPDHLGEGHRIFCLDPECGWIAGWHTHTTSHPPRIIPT